MSQVPAVAAGVVLYTAGRVAFKRLFEAGAVEKNQPEAAAPRRKRRLRRRAGKKAARPSLELPQQRWPRLSARR